MREKHQTCRITARGGTGAGPGRCSFRLMRLGRLAVLLTYGSLSGCAVITGLKLDPESGSGCARDAPRVCGIDPMRPQRFDVSGTGREPCELIRLDFGDGSRTIGGPHDFAMANQPFVAEHTYGRTAWPGLKRVRATGIGNCFGDARLGVRMMERVPANNGPGTFVFADKLVVAFAQPPLDPADQAPCKPVPLKASLRRDAVVTVRSNPDPKFRIDYGCWLSGCIYDADGEPGSTAPTGWAFPGMRQYSMVLRVGSQTVQGGNFTRFVTGSSGPLEICLNDMNLSMNDNFGGLLLSITVDEDIDR